MLPLVNLHVELFWEERQRVKGYCEKESEVQRTALISETGKDFFPVSCEVTAE